MDTFLPFLVTIISTILSMLICFVYYHLKRSTASKNSIRCTVPQAGGAWPVIGHLHLFASQQLLHKALGAMAEKYGPVFTVKFGLERVLVVSSWEMAAECFTVHDKAFSDRPNTATPKLLGYNYAMFAFSPYGPYWRQVRKIAVAELLSNHRLATLKRVRASEVETMIKELHQLCRVKGGVLIDMKERFGDLMLNISLRMVAGNGDVMRGEARKHRKSLRDFFYLFGVPMLSDSIPFLGWLDYVIGYGKAMKKTAKELDRLMEDWLEEHKQKRLLLGGKNKEELDFMDVMLNILDDAGIGDFDADTIIKATCLVRNLAAHVNIQQYLKISVLNSCQHKISYNIINHTYGR